MARYYNLIKLILPFLLSQVEGLDKDKSAALWKGRMEPISSIDWRRRHPPEPFHLAKVDGDHFVCKNDSTVQGMRESWLAIRDARRQNGELESFHKTAQKAWQIDSESFMTAEQATYETKRPDWWVGTDLAFDCSAFIQDADDWTARQTVLYRMKVRGFGDASEGLQPSCGEDVYNRLQAAAQSTETQQSHRRTRMSAGGYIPHGRSHWPEAFMANITAWGCRQNPEDMNEKLITFRAAEWIGDGLIDQIVYQSSNHRIVGSYCTLFSSSSTPEATALKDKVRASRLLRQDAAISDLTLAAMHRMNHGLDKLKFKYESQRLHQYIFSYNTAIRQALKEYLSINIGCEADEAARCAFYAAEIWGKCRGRAKRLREYVTQLHIAIHAEAHCWTKFYADMPPWEKKKTPFH